jgi:hypothetical protein
MRFLDKFKKNNPEAANPSQEATVPETYALTFISEEGKRRGADPRPLLIYGHMAQVSAKRTATDTTVNCIALSGLDMLRQAIEHVPSIGLRAMSRPEHVGEAEEGIRMYRAAIPEHRPTFYGAWDYNVERAAKRAINCGADGVEMPGILTDELYAYIFGVIDEVYQGAAIPTTVEEHIARLKKFTTEKSKFWEIQDLVVSKFY